MRLSVTSFILIQILFNKEISFLKRDSGLSSFSVTMKSIHFCMKLSSIFSSISWAISSKVVLISSSQNFLLLLFLFSDWFLFLLFWFLALFGVFIFWNSEDWSIILSSSSYSHSSWSDNLLLKRWRNVLFSEVIPIHRFY